MTPTKLLVDNLEQLAVGAQPERRRHRRLRVERPEHVVLDDGVVVVLQHDGLDALLHVAERLVRDPFVANEGNVQLALVEAA